MKNNLIYNLMRDHKAQFTIPNVLQLKEAISQEKKPYFMIDLPAAKGDQIVMDKKVYRVGAAHVTVFDGFLFEEERDSQKAHYHVTIPLTASNADQATLRVYFMNLNRVRYIQLKDKRDDEIVLENSEHIVLKAKEWAAGFIQTLFQLFHQQLTKNETEYKSLLTVLQEQSSVTFVEGSTRQACLAYRAQIKEMRTLIKKREQTEFDSYGHLEKHFSELERKVEKRIDEIDARSLIHDVPAEGVEENAVDVSREKEEAPVRKHVTKKPSASPVLRRLTEIESSLSAVKLDKSLPDYQAMIEQFKLLQEKTELVVKSDALLEAMIEQNKIRDRAPRIWLTLMLPTSKQYELLDERELRALVGILPSLTMMDLYFAVHNKRLTAVKLLLERGSSLNLDEKVRGVSLLENAYHNEARDIFKLLLESGASCNTRCQDGRTLLIRACNEQRWPEIKMLLRAGATNNLTDRQGRTALSYLMMPLEGEPNDAMVRTFILYCQSMEIDQHHTISVTPNCDITGTLLSFACMYGRMGILFELIHEGASLFAYRPSDGLSCWAVCLVYGQVETLKAILSKSAACLDEVCHGLEEMLNSKRCAKLDEKVKNNFREVLSQHLLTKEARIASALYSAIKEKHCHEAAKILGEDASDLNKLMNDDSTCLIAAVNARDIETFELLINHPDIKPNMCAKQGVTPLYLAARLGLDVMWKKLLAHPAIDPNVTDAKWAPALLVMVTREDIKGVKALLAHDRTNPNVQDSEGMGAICIAIKTNQRDILRCLVKHKKNKVDPNCLQAGETPLNLAVEQGSADIVSILLECKKINVNGRNASDDMTPLCNAAAKGKVDILKLLLRHPDIDVNLSVVTEESDMTALSLACLFGHGNAVKVLLEANLKTAINVNCQDQHGHTPLHWAVTNDNGVEIIKLLLSEDNINLVPKGNGSKMAPPLHLAVIDDKVLVVRELLSHQKSVCQQMQARSGCGMTVLHLAAQGNHQKVLEFLLSETAANLMEKGLQAAGDSSFKLNVNVLNEFDATPLILAAYKGNLNAIKILLASKRYKVNVNAMDFRGNTALHYAIHGGFLEVVRFLQLQPGIEHAVKNSRQWTAQEDASTPSSHSYLSQKMTLFPIEKQKVIRSQGVNSIQRKALSPKKNQKGL